MNLADVTHLTAAREAIAQAVRRGVRPMAVPVPVDLAEWAERHFYLSAESSYVEGRWHAYPFQRPIMQCMSNDDVQQVWLRKSARVGYTKMILAAQAYFAEHKRRNQVIYQPTDDDADEYVKTELEPMLRDLSVLRSVFKGDRQRDKENTLRAKKFLGCVLHVRGGKAAKNYRRLTVDVVHLDEVDGFDVDVEGEGSPVALARKRLEGATFPKLIGGSTPKTKGLSLIEAQEQLAVARFQFYVPCPHCGEEITLRWGGPDKPYGFKWTQGDPDSVAHLCEHCAALFTQAEYLQVWERGRFKTAPDGIWIDREGGFRGADGNRVPTPLSVGFHIWTGYSPQATWSTIVREWLAAQHKARSGDKGELKTFVNTTLGETWEEDSEGAEPHELKKRAEAYPLRSCPRGVLLLTAGIDVQDDRWEVFVWGWGRGEEAWLVDRTVFYGNPADEADWDAKLLPYLQSSFRHAGGGSLQLQATAIDTGGHFTHQAYSFVRKHARLRLWAVRGDSKDGQPIKQRSSLVDVNWAGKIIKKGVRLWFVGTDTAKDLFYGRLQVSQPGPGYVHFSHELDDEFYAQLTAEHRVQQKAARGLVFRWVKRRPRNEALDGTVYALFAAHALDLHRYTSKHWDRLEELLQPTLFDAPAAPISEPVAPDPGGAGAEVGDGATPPPASPSLPGRRLRRSGFVRTW